MRDERLTRLADLLVRYSTEVKKGDKVFVGAEDAAIPFIIEVAKAAVKAGGLVEYSVGLAEVTESILRYGDDGQAGEPDHAFGLAAREGDVWITAWGSKNVRAHNTVPPDKLALRKKGNMENRKIYASRCATGELRWCGTQFPTQSHAQEAGMSLSEYEDFVYSAGHLDESDPVAYWKNIEKEQEYWVQYLNTKSEIVVKAKNADLRINVKGRKWINCCGKANFPDGEIFTSPVEDGIDGRIAFTYPAILDGQLVENAELEIKAGKVVSASATSGLDYLNRMLSIDEGSCRFGEFAIGTNYGITQFTKNILFDEKIGGTIHLALGFAYPETGGTNESAIHWDMICDMRGDGCIYADGELFYERGKFLVC
jgi:aminopeptidase